MRDDDDDDNNLPIDQVVVSMFRVVCMIDAALGRPMRDPSDFDEMEITAYTAAVLAGVGYADANEEKPVQVDDVASAMNAAFIKSTGRNDVPKFSEIAWELRLKWRFLVKHLWNALAYDSGDDGAIQKHEETVAAIFQAALQEGRTAKAGADVRRGRDDAGHEAGQPGQDAPKAGRVEDAQANAGHAGDVEARSP